MLVRLLTPAYASVTNDAATQREAMRKSNICACNPARRKSTHRVAATHPAPCVPQLVLPGHRTPSRRGKVSLSYVVPYSPRVRPRKPHSKSRFLWKDLSGVSRNCEPKYPVGLSVPVSWQVSGYSTSGGPLRPDEFFASTAPLVLAEAVLEDALARCRWRRGR